MSNSLRITMNEHNEAKEELRNKHYSTSKELLTQCEKKFTLA